MWPPSIGFRGAFSHWCGVYWDDWRRADASLGGKKGRKERMRIYTRGGDQGKTTLIGAVRRFKDDRRVEAYGAVDEAGAFIGLAAAHLSPGRDGDIRQILESVQERLWDVGADLAAVDSDSFVRRTPSDAAQALEPLIDRYQDECEPLTYFIVRGGSKAGASLHVACTVVRRAERRAVGLMAVEPIHPPALVYLNRLSDLLFVLARALNARDQAGEMPYENGGPVFR
jgi:cob(I)alamin adenosyltransferase